jgi:hypothetical protein
MTSKAWVLVLAASPVAAQTCDLAGGQKIESPRYWLAYRTRPDWVRIGEHFALDLVSHDADRPHGRETAPALPDTSACRDG